MIFEMKPRFPHLALLVFVGLTSVNWTPEDAGIRLSDPDAVNHHGTLVTPVRDQALPPGKNVLWCATFQMAWDGAVRHLGGPLRLLPATNLADSLNRNPFDPRWVDEESVFTAGGGVDDGILTKIDDGVRATSGKPSKLLKQIRKQSSAGDLVFYAMLKKELTFENPFGKLGNRTLGERKVPWFGFTPEQENTGPLLRQVRVHHYRAKDDFVIELLSGQSGDQLLLAKLPATPETPGDAAGKVLKRLQVYAPHAQANDLLAVPNVCATEDAEFSDLHGRSVAGTRKVIRSAMQSIDFRMDEKGVKLKSEASLSLGCAARPHVRPRLMILDPPFAIVMKRRDAPEPYFVAWLANADLLGTK